MISILVGLGYIVGIILIGIAMFIPSVGPIEVACLLVLTIFISIMSVAISIVGTYEEG